MGKAERQHVDKQGRGFLITKSDEDGVVEAIVNVFGIVDTQGDIIHPGAFTKTLNERGNQIRVKVLDNHRTQSVMDIIAKAADIHEVSAADLPEVVKGMYPAATGGLYAKMEFLMDDPNSLAIYRRIASGAAEEYSIGLDIVDQDLTRMKDSNGRPITVRNIRALRLFDVSPVIWGANEGTVTIATKSVTPFEDLPLADRADAWDANAAEKSVREWAGGADATDWKKYARAFFWYDATDPEKFSSYKLGFAKVVSGKLTAVPRGIFAVAGIMSGARGGVSGITDAETTTIKNEVGKYYEKMAKEFDDDGIQVPWEKDMMTNEMSSSSGAAGGFLVPNQSPTPEENEGKKLPPAKATPAPKPPTKPKKHRAMKGDGVATLLACFLGGMMDAVNDYADDMLTCGELNLQERLAITDAVTAAMLAFEAKLPGEVAAIPAPDYMDSDDGMSDMWMWFSGLSPDEQKRLRDGGSPLQAGEKGYTGKEGRRLSTATSEKLNAIHKTASGAMDDLRTLIDDTGIEEKPEFDNADSDKEKRQAPNGSTATGPDQPPSIATREDARRMLEQRLATPIS